MKKPTYLRPGAVAALTLFALILMSGCPDPVNDVQGGTAYTVTLSQPAVGGAIGAGPLSGLAGTTITLSNSPAANYTFSHYTVDGVPITGETFPLNSSVTVSGVFTYTGGGGPPPTYAAAFNWGSNTVGIDIASDPDKVRLVIDNYTPPSAPFVISDAAHQGLLSGKPVEVWIEKGTGSETSIPLHYVHNIYQGLDGHYGITGAPVIDSVTLTPSFDGREWFLYDSTGTTNLKNLYNNYAEGNVVPVAPNGDWSLVTIGNIS
ncbi:MAG: hypothetical protein LBF77_05870, partial [Spirochaetaceae bacterium]|nr:hypothetical protein [Spirochaetaceae bacterium]